MATYQSIKKQIAGLEKQAEGLRKAEAAKVIASIRTQIAKYDLKPADLFDAAAPSPTVPAPVVITPAATPAAPRRGVLPAKYMDPLSKKTWSGHGKAPTWIKKGKRDDYLIEVVKAKLDAKPASAPKTAASKPAPSKTAASSKAAKKTAPATKKAAAPVKKNSAAVKKAAAPATVPADKKEAPAIQAPVTPASLPPAATDAPLSAPVGESSPQD